MDPHRRAQSFPNKEDGIIESVDDVSMQDIVDVGTVATSSQHMDVDVADDDSVVTHIEPSCIKQGEPAVYCNRLIGCRSVCDDSSDEREFMEEEDNETIEMSRLRLDDESEVSARVSSFDTRLSQLKKQWKLVDMFGGDKIDDEVAGMIWLRMGKNDRSQMMKDFKVSIKGLKVEAMIEKFLSERVEGFPLLEYSLLSQAEKMATTRANEPPEQREKRLAANAERNATTRANESPEQREKRLSANAERNATTRANETPEERKYRQDKDADRHRSSYIAECIPPPTSDTKTYEVPGEDYSLSRHTDSALAAQLLFLFKCVSHIEWVIGWLSAYIHVRKRFVDKGFVDTKPGCIKKLDGLYLLGKIHGLTFAEVIVRVFSDEELLTEYDYIDEMRWQYEGVELSREEAMLEWYMYKDTSSVKDRGKMLPSKEEKDMEKINKWRMHLVGMHLKVPSFWFTDTATGKQLRGNKLWLCEIVSIIPEDGAKRHFNLKCLDHDPDDPDQINRYAMAYEDVVRYVDRTQNGFHSYVLPEAHNPYKGRYDEEFNIRCNETVENHKNAPSSEKGDVLYKDAIKEVQVHMKSQVLSPKDIDDTTLKYFRSQGIGVPWAPDEVDRMFTPLYTCACCGIRNLASKDNGTQRRYIKVDLANSIELRKILRLRDCSGFDTEEVDVDRCYGMSPRTLQSHIRSMELEPITIPYNDKGDTKKVELWRMSSVWPAMSPDELKEQRRSLPDYLFEERVPNGEGGVEEPIYYHLHPEFVDEIIEDNKKRYTTMICLECKKSIDDNEIPRRSIAAGVEFGDVNRIGLEPLTDRERQIISKVRHYLLVIKIESNIDYERTKEKGQSAVKGCGVYFDDDSPHVVSNLLSRDNINGDVSLNLVGPDGEYDTLARKIFGSANVYGRAWVIYQWLKVLREVNIHYMHDDALPEFDEVKSIIESANEALVKDAECVNDEGLLRETEITKDDVRRIRTVGSNLGDCDIDFNEEYEEAGGLDFPLKCSFITSSTKYANGLDTDVDRDYLESAARALDTREEKEESITNNARRGRNPCNEYDCGDILIAKSSPDVFVYGDAYGNSGPTLTNKEIEHSLLQYTTAAACNRPLLFNLFESKWRHGVIGGMHAHVASNPDGFERFANEFSTDEFQEKLTAAVKNPNSPTGKYVLNKLTPLLTFAGRKSVFGAFERNESAGQILALGRRYGCAPAFLTFGIDDVNHPKAIRFALRSTSNQDFPAVVSSASDVEMKHGIKLREREGNIPFNWGERFQVMIKNPVGAAIAYKEVVCDIMTILFGIKPSNHSGVSSTRKSMINKDIGLIGSPWAFFGKTETTGSGSLHFHVVIWGGLSPQLLECFADIQEVCETIAEVLDSMYCVKLERHDHIRDLVQKDIRYVKSIKTKRLTGAGSLVESSVEDHTAGPQVASTDSDVPTGMLALGPNIKFDNCVGLFNLGNSCYMNAALQAIRCMKPMVDHLMSVQSHTRLVSKLCGLFIQMETTDTSYIKPSDFHTSFLCATSRRFTEGRQEDAQEFYSELIDQIHNETKIVLDGCNNLHSEQEEGQSEELIAKLSREAFRRRENSAIDEMLSGQLKFVKKCLGCGKQTSTFDESRILLLPLPVDNRTQKPPRKCSLGRCLEVMSSSEVLVGEDAVECPCCEKKTQHQRKVTLYNMPRVVVMSFKRFCKDDTKIQTCVDFDLQNVKFAGCDTTYETFAVCDHQGDKAKKGHYVANVKNLQTGKWNRLDDEECFSIDEKDVISKDNYLIFLKDRSDNWKDSVGYSKEADVICNISDVSIEKVSHLVPDSPTQEQSSQDVSGLVDNGVSCDNKSDKIETLSGTQKDCVTDGQLVDNSLSSPGFFAGYCKKTLRCVSENCQCEGLEKLQGIELNPSLKPLPSSNDSSVGDANRQSFISKPPIPRAILVPPERERLVEYKSHVAATVCACGNIHTHSFTCRKPPKGWHGCRMCYSKALVNGTKPIELVCETKDDGTLLWQELVDDQYFVRPSGEYHKIKRNLHPLRADSTRTVVWELNRPEFTEENGLPELTADDTKERIISYLYKEMVNTPKQENISLVRDGCNCLTMEQIDLHQFVQDKNNLFYNFLMGLIESSCLAPGGKSVECLRGELMNYLKSLACNLELGDKTVEQHITSRLVDKGSVGEKSFREKIEMYSRVMLNVGGDDCFAGGELEVYLFAKTQGVNIAIYIERGDKLIRVYVDNAKGKNRPTIHLLRTLNEEDTSRHRDVETVAKLKPPTFTYTLFTPKLKSIIDRLQAFDTKDLVLLYNMVAKALPARNGWVVDYNPVLTGLLGSNTNLLHLGSTEQSKAALFYIGPYINKDGVKIIDALPILKKPHEHTLVFPSIAEDTGTNKRRVQHTLTRAVNKMNNLVEVTDTQASASLLKMGASLCSDEFVTCDTQAYENYVVNELQRQGEDMYEYEDTDDELGNDHDERDVLGEGGGYQNRDSDTMFETLNDNIGDEERMILDKNRRKFWVNQNEDSKEEDLNHVNASFGGSCLYRKDDGTKQPVSYPALYRYRGEGLKDLCRYLYTALVRVDSVGRDTRSKVFEFGEGLCMTKYHHQVLRFKQLTPKFKRSPPALPGVMPNRGAESTEEYERKVKLWKRKVDAFSQFYLVMFREEDRLYKGGQVNTYKYDYEAFVDFYKQSVVHSLKRPEIMAKLKLMENVMYSWRVDSERREMLAAFRGRARTKWTPEEKEVAKSYYGDLKATSRQTSGDCMDYISSVVADMSITDSKNAKKILKHSQELLDTLDSLVARDASVSTTEDDENTKCNLSKNQVGRPIVDNVLTCSFDSGLDDSKRRPAMDGMEDEDEDQTPLRKVPSMYRYVPDLDRAVKGYIDDLNLSPDKNIAVKLVYDHFRAICSGEAEMKGYIAPNLLICGKPGCGKSKLIEAFDGMAEIMKVGEQMKCAYMGTAAVNIMGTTLLKSWDIPVFNDNNDVNVFRRWNLNKLQALKRRFGHNIYNICAVVVDEVSTMQPYMLAYLNDRMQEMFQNTKPFGGRLVILLGDFEQKPPTAGGKGNTLPGSVMMPLEKGITVSKDGKVLSEDKAKQLGARQIGGYLFSKFLYIKLTQQHRSGDPEHTAVLYKMSDTGRVSVGDLKAYKKLSSEDLTSDDFRFATIVVTGNDERRNINAWQAGRYADYHKVNVIRWARMRNENKWKGKPKTEACLVDAFRNSCFWEFFVPNAKGYLNTYGINVDDGLANGTEIKYHSLSFEDRAQDRRVRQRIEEAKPGDVISIDVIPIAVNVELFADFSGDSESEKELKRKSRRKWLQNGGGSMVGDGRVVVPISREDGTRIKYTRTYVPGRNLLESKLYYPDSQLLAKDYFPIEPAFSITIDKAQVSKLLG